MTSDEFDPFEPLEDPFDPISGDTIVEDAAESSYAPSATSEDLRQEDIFEELQTRNWYRNDPPDDEEDEEAAMAMLSKFKCLKVHTQDSTIPKNLCQAQQSKEWPQWQEAMKVEMKNMETMEAWTEIVDHLPAGKTAIDTIWIYAKKYNEHGEFLKYKARLVARGFLERLGIDYNETFAPVCRYAVVRLFCAIAAQTGLKIFQDDCTASYLNAWLEKQKWIRLPDGKYALIQKALYGLKEAPREWFSTVKAYLLSEGLTQSQYDPCVFFKKDVMLSIFVDDILSMGKGAEDFRTKFKNKFPTGSGGEAKHFIGLRITHTKSTINVDQQAYVDQKLEEFSDFLHPSTCYSSPLLPDFPNQLALAENSTETEPLFPYRSMVGSLVHVMNGTRFDIAAAVSVVSRFLNSPKKIHCDMVKRIFYYLRGNPTQLEYKKTKSTNQLLAFCDSSYANLENYSSLCGFAYKLGNSLIDWKSMRQPVVALSTAESEYIALTPCIQAGLWLRGILAELGIPQDTTPTSIFEDNAACIFMANNPQNSKRTRHIQVRYHWVRQHLEDKAFKLIPCKTHEQLADIFTKGVHGPKLRSNIAALGMNPLKSSKLGES